MQESDHLSYSQISTYLRCPHAPGGLTNVPARSTGGGVVQFLGFSTGNATRRVFF